MSTIKTINKQLIEELSLVRKTNKKEERVKLDNPSKTQNRLYQSFEIGINLVDPQNTFEVSNVKEKVYITCQKFLKYFLRKVALLEDYHLADFEKACKDRYNDLRVIMHKIQTSEPGDIMLYVYNGDNAIEDPRLVKYMKAGAEFLSIRANGDIEVLCDLSRSPKIYSILVKGLYRIMVEEYLPYKVSNPDKARIVLQLCQFIITAGNVFTFLRSDKDMIDNRELTSFIQLSQKAVPLDPKFREEVLELIHDIKEGKLPYIRELHRAIRSSITVNSIKFRETDYYTSIKRSSSYSKDFGKLPSLLASAYETDVILDISKEFDELTGYVSHYLEEVDNATTENGESISIDQNRIKRRLIHLMCNAIQDRMKIINRLLESVCMKLPSDCTRDQFRGVQAAMLWTSERYRDEHDYPTIACMDISNATDTLSQEFQELVLSAILPEEMVSWWMKVLRLPKKFNFYSFESKHYVQEIGQFQGMLSSFYAFALAHYFFMLLTMKRSGMEDILASQTFRALGDDSIINSVYGSLTIDRIIDNYVAVCKEAGWEVDLTKSHLVRHEDRYAFAEFAKVTVLDGEMVTPPPIKMLAQIKGETFDNGAREFAFGIWLAKHGYERSGVIDALIDNWTEGNRKQILSILFKGGIVPYLDEFKDPSFCEETTEWKIVALSYLRNQIRETLIDSVLNDREASSSDYLDSFIGKVTVRKKGSPYNGLNGVDLIEKLIDAVPPDHKLIWALQRNANIEDAVKSITGLDSSKLILASLELSDDEIEVIFMIQDILELAKIGELTINSDILRDINRRLAGLERYRLRSVYKKIGRMTNSLLTVVDMTIEQCENDKDKLPSVSWMDGGTQ